MRVGDILKTAAVEGKEKHVPFIEVGKGKGEGGADVCMWLWARKCAS